MYQSPCRQTAPPTFNDLSCKTFQSVKKTILLVDDDISLSFIAKSVLEKNKMNVVVAHNGKQALQLLDEIRPDAILMDVNMPQMDGYEACENIQQKFLHNPVPVMMLTGNNDIDSIRKSYRSGATDFICKPVNWPIVLQRLDFMMRSFSTSEKLKQKEISLRSLVHALPDQVIRINKKLEIIDFEYGTTFPKTSLDHHFVRETHIKVLREYGEKLQAVFSTGNMSVIEGEVILNNKPVCLEYRAVRETDDQMVVVVRDVSNIHDAQKRIHQIAFYSRDTGLPNKYYLEKNLSEKMMQTDGAIVVRIHMQELDGVKNTIPGSQYQKMMREICSRLENCARNSTPSHEQDIPNVYKLDGNEFAIVYLEKEVKISLKKVIKAVKNHLSMPFQVDQYEIQIMPTIGAARCVSCQDIKALLKQAGEAKITSGFSEKISNHIYSPALSVNSKRKMNMLSHLRHAVNKGELKLMYQPQINLKENAITGVEALLRWNSEDLGFVMPDQFIPLAEDSGLIIPIGDFVIQEALKQTKIWHQSGFSNLRVAVNFSALQVHKKNIVRFIDETLIQQDIDSKYLEIELTESALAKDLRHTTNILHQLRELGIRTAIDDFGTGFSSLSYLSQLPFDQLKIDRSFIKPLESAESNSRLLNAIITMGKSLDMEVLAEGVETEYQKFYLTNNGCDSMQGYLVSKPRDPEEIMPLLNDWRTILREVS